MSQLKICREYRKSLLLLIAGLRGLGFRGDSEMSTDRAAPSTSRGMEARSFKIPKL